MKFLLLCALLALAQAEAPKEDKRQEGPWVTPDYGDYYDWSTPDYGDYDTPDYGGPGSDCSGALSHLRDSIKMQQLLIKLTPAKKLINLVKGAVEKFKKSVHASLDLLSLFHERPEYGFAKRDFGPHEWEQLLNELKGHKHQKLRHLLHGFDRHLKLIIENLDRMEGTPDEEHMKRDLNMFLRHMEHDIDEVTHELCGDDHWTTSNPWDTTWNPWETTWAPRPTWRPRPTYNPWDTTWNPWETTWAPRPRPTGRPRPSWRPGPSGRPSPPWSPGPTWKPSPSWRPRPTGGPKPSWRPKPSGGSPVTTKPTPTTPKPK